MENKITLIIDLEIDGDLGQNSSDSSEKEWFRDHLLGDELLLYSNLIGETIGTVKVKDILGAEVTYRHISHANKRKGTIEKICQKHLVIAGRDRVLRPVEFKDVWLVENEKVK